MSRCPACLRPMTAFTKLDHRTKHSLPQAEMGTDGSTALPGRPEPDGPIVMRIDNVAWVSWQALIRHEVSKLMLPAGPYPRGSQELFTRKHIGRYPGTDTYPSGPLRWPHQRLHGKLRSAPPGWQTQADENVVYRGSVSRGGPTDTSNVPKCADARWSTDHGP